MRSIILHRTSVLKRAAYILTNLADVYFNHRPGWAISCPLHQHSVVSVKLVFFGLVLVPEHPLATREVVQRVPDQYAVGFLHHSKPLLSLEHATTQTAPYHGLDYLCRAIPQQIYCAVSHYFGFSPLDVQVRSESTLKHLCRDPFQPPPAS